MSETSDESTDASTDESTDATRKSPTERIDSSEGTFDILGEGKSGDERESGTAGLPDEDDVPDDTVKEIDEEREARLATDNRPEGAEVDNTGRTFDSGAGMFTDNEDYDESDRPFVTEDGTAPPAPSDEEGDTKDAAPDDDDQSDPDPKSGSTEQEAGRHRAD